MSGKIGIGIIGLDHWYGALPTAEAMAKAERVKLVAIADRDAERLRGVAEKQGVERWTTDYKEVIEREDIQAVATYLSTDENADVCIALAEHGKHIMSIKPVAMTLEEAEELVTAVRKAKVKFLGFEGIGRISPGNIRLKRWIKEGRIGQPISARAITRAGLPQCWPGNIDPGWFADLKRCPGGAWIDHAIYQVDSFRWLLGSEVEHVTGEVANFKYQELGLEDWGIATLRFKNGAVAILEDTWTALEGGFMSATEIIGTEGAIVNEPTVWGRLALLGKFEPFEGWVYISPPAYGDLSALDHFLDCIEKDEEPTCTVENARTNLAVCLAVYEAAKSGRVVAL